MRALLVSIIVLSFSVANAQDYLFKVLASKGDVKVEQSGSKKSLYTGGKVNKGAKVTLGENSYVGLVHSSGRSIELKSAGTYTANDLAAKISSNGDKGFAEKYAQYAWGQMNKGDGEARNMEVTGAVFRDVSSTKGFSVRKTNVMESSVLLKWTLVENAEFYKVTIMNLYEDVVLTFTTKDNSLKLDLSNLDFDKEEAYLWNVEVAEWNESAENPQKVKSDNYGLKYVGKDKASNIKEEFNNLSTELNPDESALDAIIIASFYEQNGMFMDALTYYEKAISQAPEVDDYKVAYKNFLDKNSLGKLME